jgi:hypothetical protein
MNVALTVVLVRGSYSQTASTGALTGVTLDPSSAALPGVVLSLINQDTAETQSATSDEEGRFRSLLLSPGSYQPHANKAAFDPLRRPDMNISVPETLRLELHFRLATIAQEVQVSSEPATGQTDNSALGRIVNETAVNSLPLVTRIFAQITCLSPGVATGVFNAGELGLGGIALSQVNKSTDGIYVRGARSYDNNFQLDGISVNDVQGNGSSSGGIPIPNPDTIQEFKVKTGLYDAAYGRYAGANVSVITKMGGNAFHGTIFGFLRNDVLNANDFFFNKTGQPRPTRKQNQFGLAT